MTRTTLTVEYSVSIRSFSFPTDLNKRRGKPLHHQQKTKSGRERKRRRKKKLPLGLKVPTDSLGIGSPGMSHFRFRLGHGRRAHALSPGSNLSLLLGATGANSRAPRLFITAAITTATATTTTSHAIRKTFISPTVSSSSSTSLSVYRRTASPLRPFTATTSTHRTMSSATSFYDFKPLDSMPHHHHHSTCTLSSLVSSLPPSPISCHGSIRH